MSPSSIWKNLRDDVASLYEDMVSARDTATEAVLSPARDVPVGAEYREAFVDLRWEMDSLAARTRRLLEMLAESSEPETPARPLDPLFNPVQAALGVRVHIIAGVGFVSVEGGQDGPYAVGELAREGDSLPWKVVERRPGQAPVVIDGYALREAAEAVRDEMNRYPLYRTPDPEDQPVVDGPTDDEEAQA